MPVQEGRGPWCLTNSQTWALPLAAVGQEGLTDHDEAGLAWTQLLLYSQQVSVGQQHHPTLPRLTNKSHFTQDMPDFGMKALYPGNLPLSQGPTPGLLEPTTAWIGQIEKSKHFEEAPNTSAF